MWKTLRALVTPIRRPQPVAAETSLTDERRAQVMDVIHAWAFPERLAGLARAGHGYGNSDGGYGLTYPGDLDPEDSPIPPGFVRIYGWWGENFDELVTEADYLAVLSEVLAAQGYEADAADMAALATERRSLLT